jgi:hypothetical protein
MMSLRVVEPDKPGLELRTFECPTCFETESLVASIGEAASVSWLVRRLAQVMGAIVTRPR